MSAALPGSHYCKDHQGNHSHYDPTNCELCKAKKEIEQLKAALAQQIKFRKLGY